MLGELKDPAGARSLRTELLDRYGAMPAPVERLLEVSRLRYRAEDASLLSVALESGQVVDYRRQSAESLAAEMPAQFDAVTCMEMLEHVPDPSSVVAACARLVKPGGHVFFSTINRNPKSYLLAIIGAEYVLGMLPRGTHDYARFIRPSELAGWVRAAGLSTTHIAGMTYNPLTDAYRLAEGDVDVNYLLACRREDDA